MSRNYHWTILFLACALAVLGQSAPNQRKANLPPKPHIEVEGSVLHVSIEQDPHPLALILDGLANKFGWKINYESPRYDSPEDLIDVSSPKYLADNPQGIHDFAPKGGAFAFSYLGFDASDPRNAFRTLDAIVKAYNLSNSSAAFELLTMDDGSFDVVGVGASHGPQTPVLNTKISLNVGPVSAEETIDAWASEITRVSGIRVVDGQITANNVLINTQVTIHADNLSARDVLRQIIKAIGGNYSWELGSFNTSEVVFYPLTLHSQINVTFDTSVHQNEPAASPAPTADPALIAQGKARYLYYQCDQCHGAKGEGTSDGPDLVSTLLSLDGISKFIEKPSPDARMKGMPDIPLADPDHAAIVAFVLSLKRSPVH